MRLITAEIVKLYKDMFRARKHCSVADVAEELKYRGIRTFKGTFPTRQAIHFQMKKSEEGKLLLDLTNMTKRGRAPHWNTPEDVIAYAKAQGLPTPSGD